MVKPIGILGGTFDPVHHGHLRLALEAYEVLGLEEVRLIPSLIPPHRNTPLASNEQRFAMLELAIKDLNNIVVDRELKRKGPSYTIDTLKDLRYEFNDVPLCMILGMDAFQQINSWNSWMQLLEYTHIIVAVRPRSNTSFDHQEVAELYGKNFVEDRYSIHEKLCGYILKINVPMLNIASTYIRELFVAHKQVQYLLPDAVISYIFDEGLYQCK